MVFVNSMSDLFHPEVPFSFIQKVFTVMGRNAAAHLPDSHKAFQATCLGRPRVALVSERLDGGEC